MNEPVLYERRGKVALITLNQPDRLNALSLEVRAGLRRAYGDAENDPAIEVIVLTGAGRAFCAGNDIKLLNFTGEAARADIADTLDLSHHAERLKKLVIAAANGYALGGGFEIALGCDLIVAAERAEFGTPAVNIGLAAGFAMLRLPPIIGKHAAMALLTTGDRINANEAHRLGFVYKVTANDDLLAKTLLVADKICSKGPLAVQLYKRFVNRNLDDADLARAVDACEFLFATEDQKEGRSAFLEKRLPIFHGR